MLHDLLILTLIAAAIAIAIGSFIGCLVAALKVSDRVKHPWGPVAYAVTGTFLVILVLGTEYLIADWALS